MSSRRAVLDANVLYPFLLRDLLLWAAERESFEPRWSEETMNELREHLPEQGMTKAQIDRMLAQMNAAFPDAEVKGYEGRFDQLRAVAAVRDPDDLHVLAAAVHSNSELIVTEDRHAFDEGKLKTLQVERQTADQFMTALFTNPQTRGSVYQSLVDLRGSLRRGQPSMPELLTSLEERAHLGQFVNAVRSDLQKGMPGVTADAIDDQTIGSRVRQIDEGIAL
jgi:predicted nucleic acid-binding protein